MDIASLSRELILHEPVIIINIEKSISSVPLRFCRQAFAL